MSSTQVHEQDECPKRLVPCDRRCGEWVAADALDHHMTVMCIKRPFPEIWCRLGCGVYFKGGAHEVLQLEAKRLELGERDGGKYVLKPALWAEVDVTHPFYSGEEARQVAKRRHDLRAAATPPAAAATTACRPCAMSARVDCECSREESSGR